MILNNPVAIEAAERFQRQVDALRAEYPGLAHVRLVTQPTEVSYFDTLAQSMEVTLVPAVEPIREADCQHPSLETMQGGFPWVCDHYPWPKGADGGCLAPLLQVRLADLRPHVQVEFPDLLVQFWGEEWEITTRSVPMEHARVCKRGGRRESHSSRVSFISRLELGARRESLHRIDNATARNGPENISGLRFVQMHLGQVSIEGQVINLGVDIGCEDDFVSFDAEPGERFSDRYRERAASFASALEDLETMQLIAPQRPAPALRPETESVPVGEFFRFPYGGNHLFPDDIAEGWRPLFACDGGDCGLWVPELWALYFAYRRVDGEFEFRGSIVG